MTTIPINDTTPKNSYVATAGQTVFPYTFWLTQEGDIQVYVNETLRPSTDYTVSNLQDVSGGNITFTTGLAEDDVVVLVRDSIIERTADFETSGAFFASAVNLEYTYGVVVDQDLDLKVGTSLKLAPFETSTVNMDIPTVEGNEGNLLRLALDTMTSEYSWTFVSPTELFTATIPDGAVTLPKLADGTVNTVIGYSDTGSPREFSGGSGITIDGVAGTISADLAGLDVQEEGSSVGTFTALNFIGASVEATDGGSGVADVTVTITGVGENTLTLDRLVQIPDQTILGNVSGGTEDVVALTSTEATGLLDAATETAPGVIELATEAEVLAGTDAERAVTPDTLQAKIDALPSGGGNVQRDVFIASGTWTKPAGVDQVRVWVTGGGGGGGAPFINFNGGAGGTSSFGTFVTAAGGALGGGSNGSEGQGIGATTFTGTGIIGTGLSLGSGDALGTEGGHSYWGAGGTGGDGSVDLRGRNGASFGAGGAGGSSASTGIGYGGAAGDTRTAIVDVSGETSVPITIGAGGAANTAPAGSTRDGGFGSIGVVIVEYVN